MSLFDFMDESSEMFLESDKILTEGKKEVTEEDIKNIKTKISDLKKMKYAKADNIKEVIHDSFEEFFTIFFTSFSTTGVILAPGISKLYYLIPSLIGTIITTIISKVTVPKTKVSLLVQTKNEINKLINTNKKNLKKANDKDKETIIKTNESLYKLIKDCDDAIKIAQEDLQIGKNEACNFNFV